MDYEKAYKAVLQTATQWIKDGCTDKEKICLECIFPELRESEDERIRRELIEYLKGDLDDITTDDTDRWIAYLEKQKEQEHICDSDQYEEGFKTGLEIGLRKQKEQKPAEWSEEDKNELAVIISVIEDDKAVAVKQYPKCKALHNAYDRMLRFLKSLRPQQNAELTLLDENIIKAAVAFVEQNDHFNCWGGIDKHTVIKALRSLKPSWKPSEELLQALHTAAYLREMDFYGGLKDKLRELDTQLRERI